MNSILFDLEANGLEPTKVWCITAYSLEFKKTLTFDKDHLQAGVDLLLQADWLLGHNIIGYDIPVLERFFNFDYRGNIMDTLILSRTLNPDRHLPMTCPTHVEVEGSKVIVGPHGLQAWGFRVENKKPHIESFQEYTTDILNRCEEDVKTNLLTYHKLLEEACLTHEELIDLSTLPSFLNQATTHTVRDYGG